MTLSQSSVIKLYKSVIEDTIASSREAFLDEGVDEQVLMDLKQLWEAKVLNSKAVQIDPPPEQTEAPSTSKKNQSTKKESASNVNSNVQNTQVASETIQQNIPNGTTVVDTAPQQVPIPAPAPAPAPLPQQPPQLQHQPQPPQQPMFPNVIDPRGIVPIQITLPPPVGVQNGTNRVLTIQVPATALTGNKLQQVLTGPVISAIMSLPQAQASNLLQQHVNAVLQGQNSPLIVKAVSQVDGITHDDDIHIEFPDIFALYRALNNNHSRKIMERKRKSRFEQKVPQIDGGSDSAHGLLDDSSEDEDDVSDEPSENEEIDEAEEEESADIDDGGMEEEPLNSEDDVSEEDPSDLFDTENVVVCQYDKINRNRNKWKFYLKDGIMNLHGKDYIFQKMLGDAEW